MAGPDITPILDRIAAAGKAYGNDEAGSRDTLVELSLALLGQLEIPSEFLQRTFWAEPCKSAIIRTCVEQKIFQHLNEAGDDGLTTEQLAQKTGADWNLPLLQRLMRHLCAMHVIALAQGKWRGTPLSNGLSEQNYQSSVEFCYDSGMPSFYRFPKFFKHSGYKGPKSDNDGPFQYAWETDVPFFPWLEANPPNLANFAQFMSAYRAGKPSWYDPGFYPVKERILEGFDPSYSDVVLCDVGGGRGHDMVEFAARYPSLPGKIVLQDLAPVLASIDIENPPFEAQTHDFYTPQPVKARAYSLHSILHDWGDDEGVKILENLRPALKPGYSKVLLFEIVVAEENPSFASTTMDMQMFAHLSALERTESHFRALCARAGFKIAKIYSYPGVAESVIELELSDDLLN